MENERFPLRQFVDGTGDTTRRREAAMKRVAFANTKSDNCLFPANLFGESRKLIAVAAGLVLISALGTAHSQEKSSDSDIGYPVRHVTLVVPFDAGGSTDTLARLAAQALSGELGQSFIVENVSGAGGVIGAAQVAKAQPDGYRLLVGTPGSIAINPQIHDVSYNPASDFEAIALIGITPAAVLVASDSPITDVQQMIAQAKAKPGVLMFGSAGVGSYYHLNGELFNKCAGVDIRHVPYRGMAPAMLDLLAGRIDVMFADVQTYLANRTKIRALAVGSPQRSNLAPDLPTAAELGLSCFHSESWTGLFAPAHTPAAIVNKLNAALTKDMQEPATAQRLTDLGMELEVLTPQAFAKFVATEIAETGKLVQEAHIKLE